MAYKSYKEQNISALYKILGLFESYQKDEITEDEYMTYLNRTKVRFDGMPYEEISDTLEGLIKNKTTLNHKTVKSVVFNLIDVYKRESVE